MNEWLRGALGAISLLEADIPSVLMRFRKLKFRRHVPEQELDETSNSAYRDEVDRLIDFDFDALHQAVKALELARQAVELKLSTARKPKRQRERPVPRRPPIGAGPPEPQRRRAPSLMEADAEIGGTDERTRKGRAFDRERLKRARYALHLTQEQAAAWFQVTKRNYQRWEKGESRMHQDNHGCYVQFIKCAERELTVPPQCDAKKSPSVAKKAP